MSDEPTARYYDESKNTAGVFLPGVPLADLSASQWAALPEWLQASIDATGWYSETRPAGKKAARVDDTSERE
jgi:hypothetical protein